MRVRNHIVEAGDDQPNPRNNDAENNGADGDDGEGIHGNLHVAVSMQVTVSIGSLQSYSRTQSRSARSAYLDGSQRRRQHVYNLPAR